MANLHTTSEQIRGALKKLFSKRSTNASAKKEKFIKRQPKKLDGFDFLMAMTVGRFKKSAS
jgi:hypothetical protein